MGWASSYSRGGEVPLPPPLSPALAQIHREALVEMGWHSTPLTPGTSLCESIFSSQPDPASHPSWCGGEGLGPAYSGSTHAMGGEAVASESSRPGTGWELWLSEELQYGSRTRPWAWPRTGPRERLGQPHAKRPWEATGPAQGPSLVNRFAPMKGQPKWSSQPGSRVR